MTYNEADVRGGLLNESLARVESVSLVCHKDSRGTH